VATALSVAKTLEEKKTSVESEVLLHCRGVRPAVDRLCIKSALKLGGRSVQEMGLQRHVHIVGKVGWMNVSVSHDEAEVLASHHSGGA
jgi:hypothetical protein